MIHENILVDDLDQIEKLFVNFSEGIFNNRNNCINNVLLMITFLTLSKYSILIRGILKLMQDGELIFIRVRRGSLVPSHVMYAYDL